MTGQRIFISHASENADIAERIVAYLESRDTPCWISSRDISPKEIYAEAIAQAMRDAQSCIVIVSAASNGSAAVKRELELASRYNKPFIPIRIDATEPGPGLDYYLNNTQWVDYGRDRERALDRIISAYAARTGAAPPAPAANARAPKSGNPLLIPIIAAALVIGGVGWFAAAKLWPGAPDGDTRQADVTQITAILSGPYMWDGVQCGQGPTVTAEGDALVFTMTGTPTYRHQVLSATRNPQGYEINVHTRVAEPAEARGQEYFLSLDNDAGVLTLSTAGRRDQWLQCDLTAP